MIKSKKADFVLTGQWATKAFDEAKRFGVAKAVASSKDKTFSYIPKLDKKDFTPDADYFHICINNTIFGTRWTEFPDTGKVPLVGDMSSSILSEPIDVSKFGIIYAGAQKNMGPAGLTVVIVRKDLIPDFGDSNVPTMLRYKTHADAGSMFNTPPTYGIYILKLVLEWVKGKGGLSAMKKLNEEKAAVLYNALDESKLFNATVQGKDRSLMNVPFVTGNADLDAEFIADAKKAGIINIKGYKTVGGMRASIYNAMPIEGVKALVDFMKKFEASHK